MREKKRLNDLIKRYKIYGHIIILFIGMVLVAVITSISDLSPHMYNIGMGIGCSVMAAPIVSLIRIFLISDEVDEKTLVEEWGIIKIYDKKNYMEVTSQRFPKSRLDFVAFGLSDFRRENEKNIIIKKMKKGLNIRILTLNPNSIYIKEREKIEDNNISRDIVDLIKWVKEIQTEIKKYKKMQGSLSIKFYNSLPLDFYCRTDNSIYVRPYVPDKVGRERIMYQFQVGSKGGEYYEEIFETLWLERSNIKTSDSYNNYFYINQKKSIEAIMEYFSDDFGKDLTMPVIGVVAIFKGEKRRTFFSCKKNKPEKHACHRKDEGAVGKLIELNEKKNLDKVLYFCDYKNEMAFAYIYQNRKEYIKKVEKAKIQEGNDDMEAILTVPLVIEEQIIGALSFDFGKIPCSYASKKNEFLALENEKELEGECKEILEQLFTEADKSGKLIAYLLGEGMETEYRKLYEEEWE